VPIGEIGNTNFKVFGLTHLGLELKSTAHEASTLGINQTDVYRVTLNL